MYYKKEGEGGGEKKKERKKEKKRDEIEREKELMKESRAEGPGGQSKGSEGGDSHRRYMSLPTVSVTSLPL